MRPIVHLDPPPETELLGTALLFRGRPVPLLQQALSGHLRNLKRDGLPIPEYALQALAALEGARNAMAAQGRTDASDMADVRSRASPRKSVPREQIDIREVARMLGVGDRQARRLAYSLGGHKRHGRWIFDRRDVEAYRQAAG